MTRKKKKRTEPILPPGDKIVTEEQADFATKMVLGALIPELERIAAQGLNTQAALLAFVERLKARIDG